LIQEVIELSFFRSPTAATIVGLKLVHPHWRQVIENSTTFKHTEQQPYDVVFGVLVARERPYGDRPNLGTMDLIAIQPPEDAKLRVVPDGAFEDPSGLIVSVDFSACDKLETIGKDAFAASPLFRVDLSDCSMLRSIGSFAFANWSDHYNDETLKKQRMEEIMLNYHGKLVGLLPMQTLVGVRSVLILSGCRALKHIGYYACSDMELDELDLRSCVALERIGCNAFAGALLLELDLSHCVALKWIKPEVFLRSPLTELELLGCVALEKIGEGAFKLANLTTLDLSGCTALEEVGEWAFCSSPLEKLNLQIEGRKRPVRVGSTSFGLAKIYGFPHGAKLLNPIVYGR